VNEFTGAYNRNANLLEPKNVSLHHQTASQPAAATATDLCCSHRWLWHFSEAINVKNIHKHVALCQCASFPFSPQAFHKHTIVVVVCQKRDTAEFLSYVPSWQANSRRSENKKNFGKTL